MRLVVCAKCSAKRGKLVAHEAGKCEAEGTQDEGTREVAGKLHVKAPIPE